MNLGSARHQKISIQLVLRGHKLINRMGAGQDLYLKSADAQQVTSTVPGRCHDVKPIMVSLSLIGFKLLSGQEFYAQGHCDL